LKVSRTELEGVLLVEPTVHGDGRGRFFESYTKEKYRELGNITFLEILPGQFWRSDGAIFFPRNPSGCALNLTGLELTPRKGRYV